MQSIFKKKHQKLILQCYPSPKLSVTETKPNQSELSYLVFYASSRRTKLEKVGIFLLKKTESDISHKRVGHLKVTLYILQELMNKCTEDLGFLTPYILQIIGKIVELGDYSTCELSCNIFIEYCEMLQPIQKQVLSSNDSNLRNLLTILSKFLSFSTSANEWSTMSLKISLCIADYIESQFSQFNNYNLIGKSIFILLDTITFNKIDLTLSKILTANDAPVGENVHDLAIASLKSFFDTGSKHQLDTSILNVLSYLMRNKKDLNWANKIMIICTKKSHIELRHRIMLILTNEIESKLHENSINLVEYLAKIQSNLLSSDEVQFLSLPLLEILVKVIGFEKQMVISDHLNLKTTYSDLIRSLFTIIYYNKQVNDLIVEIISYYYQEYYSGTLNDKQFLQFSKIVIGNIRDILNVCEKPNIKLKRTYYSKSLFNYLFLIIGFEKYYSVCEKLQLIWLRFLEEFYKENQEDLSKPNMDLIIVNNNDNNLCLFFKGAEKILESLCATEVKAQLAATISAMIRPFKINFLMNYLKFSTNWISNMQDFKYCVSLLILGLSSNEICFEDKQNAKTLAILADSKISYLQKMNLWPDYLSYQSTTEPNENILTTEELYTTLFEIPEIRKWLDKVDISHLPLISKSTPKPRPSAVLLSAAGSIKSISFTPKNQNNEEPFQKINGDTTTEPSTVDEMLTGNGTNTTDDVAGNADTSTGLTSDTSSILTHDFQYSFIQQPMRAGTALAPGNRSVYSSALSMRSGRRINLREVKDSTELDRNFERLVKTRTGGTLRATSHNTAINGVKDNQSVTKRQPLAFQIGVLDLDD